MIGLTGQSGAGKTTVSRVFSQNGFAVIDADIISREVTEKGQPCLTELSEAFGSDIINPTALSTESVSAALFFPTEKSSDS